MPERRDKDEDFARGIFQAAEKKRRCRFNRELRMRLVQNIPAMEQADKNYRNRGGGMTCIGRFKSTFFLKGQY